MISIDLPMPTSTNRVRKWAGYRFADSKEYKAWKKEAGWVLKLQKPGHIRGPVELEYRFGKSRGDLGNFEKAATDLLVTHGVIEDDGPAIVRRINLTLDESISGCRVTVRPLEPRGSRAVSDILHGDA